MQVAASHRLLFLSVDDGAAKAAHTVPSLLRNGLSLGGRKFSALFFKVKDAVANVHAVSDECSAVISTSGSTPRLAIQVAI